MKFRIKMTLCMVALLSVLFGIGGSLLMSGSFQNALAREREAARSAYQMVLRTLAMVSSAKKTTSEAEIADTLRQLAEQSVGVWAALRLTLPQGVGYETGPALAWLADETAQQAPAQGSLRQFHAPDGGWFLQLSGAFVAGDNTLRLDAAYEISSVYEARAAQQRVYQWVFGGMVFLCVLLSFGISWFLTQPLSGLSRASRALAAGKLSYRARICSRDEIGQLAADFNTMAAQIERGMAELTEAVARQERFMGSFAHELKTPMTSVIGYADLLRGGMLSPQEQLDAAGYIFSEGRRLENLSLKLLDLLVLHECKPELRPICPGRLVAELTQPLKAVWLAGGIALSTTCDAGVCFLEPDLFGSLLLNLLDNARKALADGGCVTVRLELTSQGCRLLVCDNGPGIPPEALAHLTEAFYRVDKSRARNQGGVGLGLALCREIAAAHDGKLIFASEQGHGTTVTAELRGGRP